ncbi:MAG TPA: hypothetical protein VL128_01390 [Candidatus Eisenbacteria bacterium]|nr:hypothetical protein [Candidatus Eisenbacteria bacterium]
MASEEKIGTHQKALSINLDDSVFGSFAEIGAGQEVARWFLTVGAASGTVAKTISAYDKEVSDDLYGKGTRYVSQQRLQAMMEHEWKQLLSELKESRGANTSFFAFVDTISARNFQGTNECHGWVGIRFQQTAGGPASDVVLHVNLEDPTNLQQQMAVGILGVNLIYGVFHHLGSIEEFLEGVFEDLSLERMEIDSVQLEGPAFDGWNRRKLHATLVNNGYAEAVAFGADGSLPAPTDLLYKKALVLAPGMFERVSELHGQLIETTLAQVPKSELEQSKGSLGMFCLSSQPVLKGSAPPTTEQVLRHVDDLQKLGFGTLFFRASELYTMSEYVSRYTKSQVYFAVGLSVMIYALQDRYANLEGALLEGVARLFSQNVRLGVYPMEAKALEGRLGEMKASQWKYKVTDGLVYAEDLEPMEPVNHLFRYLLGCGFIVSARPAKASDAAGGS